ncbi:ImpA family metalloprotease [Vibrio rotiferianus]|uniref:ImpA family metalloprotease n=1 Tax=Vibrio rotiferianus TaxID=190895 RepID=UPI000B59BE80|nr:ImpA family metalloprotease [Vibrio rotiferianus]
MKKLILASMIATALTGCGGGSDDPSAQFDKPVIKEIPKLEAQVQNPDSDVFTYSIDAFSVSGEDLVFGLEENEHTWITINPITGVISVDLNYAVTGTYTFVVTASDSNAVQKQTVTLEIATFEVDPNNPEPVVSDIPTINARTNVVSTFQIEAIDNEPMSFSLEGTESNPLPEFVSIDHKTGLITVDAHSGSQDTYEFIAKVSDGNKAVEKTVTLVVSFYADPENPDFQNTVPSVKAIDPISVKTGKSDSSQIYANDADGDFLSYVLASDAPEWVSVDQDGVIIAKPSDEHVGNYSFNAIISDGFVDVNRSVSVLVTSSTPPVTNTPPSVAYFDDVHAKPNKETIVRVNAADAEGDELSYSLSQNPDWVSINAAGVISVTPTTSEQGKHTFTVTVSDGTYNVEREISVRVFVSPDHVDQAVVSEDHNLATEAQLLERAKEIILEKAVEKEALLTRLFTGVDSIDWIPSHDSQIITSFSSINDSTVILQSNSNQSGGESNATLAVAGTKPNGQNYVIFGGNPFGVHGSGDIDIYLKNVINWLIGESKITLNVMAVNQPNSGYFYHHNNTKTWLENNYPENHTLNDYRTCEYENIRACAMESRPDFVILGSDDSAGRGYEGIKASMEYLEQQKIPFILVSHLRHASALISPILIESGVTTDTNYWSKVTLSGANKDNISALTDQRLDVVQDFINDEYDMSAVDACGSNYIVCDTAPFWSAFRTSADALRNDILFFDKFNIDPFSVDGSELAKTILLLADKYRSEIDYPISFSEPEEWYHAMFADWMVSYSRPDNLAQSDLGEYIHKGDPVKGDLAHYEYPETTTKTKNISVPYANQWTGTGWYALPSQPVTLTRSGVDTHDVFVKLYYARPNTNRAFETNSYNRPLELTTQRLTIPPQGSVTFSTPYGAPIYLHINGDGESELTTNITASGITEHPFIDDFTSEEQIAQFEQLVNTTDLPHVDLKSPSYEQHARKDKLGEGDVRQLLTMLRDEHINGIYSLAGFKVQGQSLDQSTDKDAMAICKTKMGVEDCTDETLHVRKIIQHANYDRHAQCGVGCSGNPWDSAYNISPRGWLDGHELGHNLQTGRLRVGYATEENRNLWNQYSDRAGENSNNIFPYYVMWNGHAVVDGDTTPLNDGHMNGKETFFALQSDYSNVTDADGNRVVYTPTCGTLDAGKTSRHEAIWSNGGYAAINGIRMSFYTQMALQMHGKSLADDSVLESGWGIYPMLYLHERIYGKYAKDETTWNANRERLGFAMFDWSNSHGTMNGIQGNDFMLVSLSYLTGMDWNSYFEMYGLRNSDTAKAQASAHGVKGAVPVGMYVHEQDLPPANMSAGMTWLPLGGADTVWTRDDSSPANCQ